MSDDFDPNTLFLINKNGFPMEQRTWSQMFRFAEHLSDGIRSVEISQLENSQGEKDAPIPSPPLNFSSKVPIPVRIGIIQDYMKELQYNHTGTQFFDIKKNRPLSGMVDVAKDMIRESLPIKCLEAVVLGIYLTNGFNGLERFTIGFRSEFDGIQHRHVVLGLYYAGNFGALGLSRRCDLMYKPLVYKSLYDLIMDYKRSYERYWHELKRIKIGLPINHDPHSFEGIPWKGTMIFMKNMDNENLKQLLDKYSRVLKSNGVAGFPTYMSHSKSEISLHYTKSSSKIQSGTKQSKRDSRCSKNSYQIRI